MAIVLGWRAMELCHCSRCGWCLRGKYGHSFWGPDELCRRAHQHGATSAAAACAGYSRVAAEGLGYDKDHQPPLAPHPAPAIGCTCGFYLLWQPDRREVPAGLYYNSRESPPLWAWVYVVALEQAIVHVKGARMGRFRVLRLYVPEPVRQGKHDAVAYVFEAPGQAGRPVPAAEAMAAWTARSGLEWYTGDPYHDAELLPWGVRDDDETYDLVRRMMEETRRDRLAKVS